MTSNARCPRCGYDQRGVMVTWSESCPMTGRCSECGHEFHWSEVLHPEKYEPDWCVEFTSRVRSVPKASVKTLLRSLWPWKFWLRMSMAYPIRPVRIMLYLFLIGLLPPLAAYVAIQTTAAIRVRNLVQADLDQGIAATPGYIANLEEFLLSIEVMPMAHDLYSVLRRDSLRRAVAVAKADLAQPPTIQISCWRAAWEALSAPEGLKSKGFIKTVHGNAPYPNPGELYSIIDAAGIGSFGGNWPGYGCSDGLFSRLFKGLKRSSEASIGGFVYNTAVYFTFPLSLVLLPVTRKTAKVRWAHIGRVTAYSLIVPILVFHACMLLLAAQMLWPYFDNLSHILIANLTLETPLLALIVWWAVAIKRYLKMPHGAGIAMLMTILSILVALAVPFLIVQILYGWVE